MPISAFFVVNKTQVAKQTTESSFVSQDEHASTGSGKFKAGSRSDVCFPSNVQCPSETRR